MSNDPFIDYVCQLHAEKHAVYGDSWKRRGEQVAILANIARKIDRLGVGGAGDTSADTAIDALVYLAKYRLWLTDALGEPMPFSGKTPLGDGPEPVERLLRSLPGGGSPDVPGLIRYEKEVFEKLLITVELDAPRYYRVNGMLTAMLPLARILWEQEQ